MSRETNTHVQQCCNKLMTKKKVQSQMRGSTYQQSLSAPSMLHTLLLTVSESQNTCDKRIQASCQALSGDERKGVVGGTLMPDVQNLS